MESPLLKGTVEWEAARCAAAFALTRFEVPQLKYEAENLDAFIGWNSLYQVRFWISHLDNKLAEISVRAEAIPVEEGRKFDPFNPYGQPCDVMRMVHTARPFWKVRQPRPESAEYVSRALFCLGVDSEQVQNDLGIWPSAHERLELRLSMPREFWPAAWLNEVTQTSV